MLQLHELLADLAVERPLFHSESDFQHAFAWLLHRMHPELAVRLEIPVRRGGMTRHIDVLASTGENRIAVELKYKTRLLAVATMEEDFHLANQAAQDLGRHDFIKDIERLELFAAGDRGTSGYAVLLTNDSTYWTRAREPDSVDAAFRLHPGRVLSGALAWDARASAGTVRNREKPIVLSGSYRLEWRDYSLVGSPRHGAFKYLAVEVRNDAQANNVVNPTQSPCWL